MKLHGHSEAVAAFVAEVGEVCRKHGFSIESAEYGPLAIWDFDARGNYDLEHAYDQSGIKRDGGGTVLKSQA